MEEFTKNAFCVIGKVGSTNDGQGFIQRLWQEANAHFEEVSALAKRTENGSLRGIWGAMTNFAFEFAPWEDNFSKGLYLAGVEAQEDAVAPKGWKKWILPGFTYLKVKVEGEETFPNMIAYLREQEIPLVGAVQDFTDPETGAQYMLFPIRRNDSKLDLIRGIKDATDPVSVCTHHCEYCFLGQWCGGCRSACNVCSMATLSEENVCENVRCAEEKGYHTCAQCGELTECKKGFYGEKTGHTPKATALYVRKYGEAAYSHRLKQAIDAGLRYAETLDEAGSVEAALEILETFE